MYLYLVPIAVISIALFLLLSFLKIKGFPFFQSLGWSIIRLPLWAGLISVGVLASLLMSLGWSRLEPHFTKNEPATESKATVYPVSEEPKPTVSKEDETIKPVSTTLPAAIVKKVHGVTGGFWLEDSTWFTAEFHNSSEYTITTVAIKIRLTDKKTEEVKWYQVILGPPGSLIPPGQTAVLSADVGVTRKGKEFFWDVVEMEGYKGNPKSL
ncbi:MAG TPA: hypothetical protein VMX13_01550 [Sedimentisphaerales bacterium]|nr:hypothetical protein [Sedimentisphaerales bacterium]